MNIMSAYFVMIRRLKLHLTFVRTAVLLEKSGQKCQGSHWDADFRATSPLKPDETVISAAIEGKIEDKHGYE